MVIFVEDFVQLVKVVDEEVGELFEFQCVVVFECVVWFDCFDEVGWFDVIIEDVDSCGCFVFFWEMFFE